MKSGKVYVSLLVLAVGIATVYVWGGSIAAAEEDEVSVALDQTPGPVRTAIEENTMNATDVTIVSEEDDGFTVYEIDFLLKGIEHSLHVTGSGEVYENEHVVSGSNIPEAVLTEILEEHPKAEILEVEKVVSTYYEVTFVSGKKEREAKVYANGQEVECED